MDEIEGSSSEEDYDNEEAMLCFMANDNEGDENEVENDNHS